MMNEAPKLLPCPFCGGHAAEPYFDDEGRRGEVYCEKCYACTQGSYQSGAKGDEGEALSISEAIAAWNTRDTTHAIAMVAAAYEDAARLVEGSPLPESPKHYTHWPEISKGNAANDSDCVILARKTATAIRALARTTPREKETGQEVYFGCADQLGKDWE